MWLFTETGFVSAVVHYEDPDVLVVRARDRASLTDMATQFDKQIFETPRNDYPYRVFMSKHQMSEWMHATIMDADYTNYKNRMHMVRDEKFVDALHDVWSVMYGTTGDERRRMTNIVPTPPAPKKSKKAAKRL